MMTLEEAIKHCKDVALSCTNKECALEHFQLLKWLQEYSNMLEKQGKKPQGKTALEAIKEEKVDNANKIEPKFKVGGYQSNDGILDHKAAITAVKKLYKQKPAWSKEDERIYQSIMDDTVQENQLNNEQTNWLRDIKYRYFQQPKQEWSEEDIRNIENIDSVLFYDVDLPEDTCVRLRNWLKSLKERVQPQLKQEWSKEDENFFNDTIAFFEDTKNALDHADWIKSLKQRIVG